MSRCFPFPPPGYGARSEALIESIKLREEIEKKRREKKEKKRIKKEKKREKNEKKEKKEKKERKHREGTTTAANGSDDGKKFKLINDIKESKADGHLQKGEVCENELLERSGITEELEQPVTSREPCCLSDSTQSSKRKRGSPQSTTHENGPAIKIRLPLRKHSDPEESNSKSKFQLGSSSGRVLEIADSLTKTTIPSESQSKCVINTGPKRILGNSNSSSCKVLQNSVNGNAVITKNTLGSGRQSPCIMTGEPKRVLGNSDSRLGKDKHNSVRRDVVLPNNTLGNDSQSQSLRTAEPKRVFGNSVSRHGNVMQNSVHGDALVAKNTLGNDCQSQSLRTAVPKRVLGNSDSGHAKFMRNSVNGSAVVDKSTLGSDRQLQSLELEVPKRVVRNSGKAMQNSVRGDAGVAKSTLENYSQLQSLRNTEPKRVLGISDSRHGKAVQNLVPGVAVVTENTPGSDRQSKPKQDRRKPGSKHSQAVTAMDKDNAVGDAMDIVNAVDDGSNKMVSLYKSLLQIPPLTYDELESTIDQDWLFSSEPAEAKQPASKKQKCETDVFKLSSSMWPRAQYFPEVDVYALPYAVPF